MSMREAVLLARAALDDRGVDSIGYCVAGHGLVDTDEVEGESHGACPGPVIVVVRDPNAQPPEPVPGGVEREAPPCARCLQPTRIWFDVGENGRVMRVAGEGVESRELSFTLRSGEDALTVCTRCLARALADLEISLTAVNGATVEWRL